ncbi:MAG: glycosyltransferase family 2 protein [Candidatus Omnitrophica bacterium]|nr:glycosyltransferase family 2 protein [Candidatus Omnitrophota bacterium]
MNRDRRLQRFLEIVPGAFSWGSIVCLIVLAIVRPVACAVFVIVFDFYWIIRTTYLTILLVMAHRRLMKEKDRNWLHACERLAPGKDFRSLYHLVIFPAYKEEPEVLRSSLAALAKSHYPMDRVIVVAAFEERHKPSRQVARVLEGEWAGRFHGYLSTFHPDGIPGERRLKGANATWAAKQAKDLLEKRRIGLDQVIVSCFDADTCVDREYFGCLTYHFLTHPRPHQASYQPIPVYNNNIWTAPSFARVVELSASFVQLIESMRLEKFVTFSSHSMSFKTLVDMGYWPVDMVSDDSVVYWKAYLHFKGDYEVVPLYTTVSMDVAYSSNFFKTLVVQYKQKKRWAFGVENFPFVVSGFLRTPGIPLAKKVRRSFHLLESHVTWALWATIIVVIAPLPVALGGRFFAQSPIGYNLPRITGLLFDFTMWTSLVWLVLSRMILPPRPRGVPWFTSVIMLAEWVMVPFIVIVLGSTPALDAQTRLLFGKYLEFFPTEKSRRVV